FMRFKIGTDLGIVLAKGVFISMVSIFTIMPALLLMFDKPLRKTKKKVLHIPMGAVSRFSYRYRRLLAGAFVVLLVGSYFLQGITETTFALKQNDPIADVFPKTNTIVMLYENADDEKVTRIAEQLKGDPHVKDALSYSTTLGKQYSAAELADVIKDMGIDMEIDPAMLDILYYDYYTQGKTYPITASDFLRFIADNVVNNETFAGQMGGDIKENMDGIKKFSNAADLTRPMNASELANYFGMKSAEVEQLLLYYYMQRGGANTGTMTLPSFAHFIANDVASDPNYASMMDAATLSQMKRLTDFTNVQKVTAKSSYKELAQLFGMEPEQMKMLFAYYFVFSGKAFDFSELPKMDSDMLKTLLTRDGSYENAGLWRLSAQTLVNFLVDHNRQLGPILSGDRLSQLKTAQKIINGSVAGTKYSSGELADIMGMNGQQTYQLYLLHTAKYGDTSGWKISVQDFVEFMVSDVLPNKNFSAQFNADTANELKTAQTIIDAVVSGQAYTVEELSGIMGGLSNQFNSDNLELLYLYYASVTHSDPGWKLSIQALFSYLNEEVVNDPRFEKVIGGKFRNDIAAMKTQLNDAVLQLKDAHYSRLILNTTFPDESEESSAFIADLKAKCDQQLTGNYYLIGSFPMNYEMAQTFDHEMLFIALLTALAIFTVVALTFRSFVIPAVLVLIVQCGVFITIAMSGLRGYDIYYLSSIIVQCILMGATIDYGILFTNYYREKRQTMELQAALAAAYNGSIHTILTSGLIMVLVLGVIGALPCDPSIGTICQTLSIGTLSAVLLVLFVLPGLLAAFDRFIVKNNRPEKIS
ncbi:MAG TPA: MMPL family transporter, partial [Syntrophomonas sp.]|nr:MMPL family transporter [Syntrophomonas sp.]